MTSDSTAYDGSEAASLRNFLVSQRETMVHKVAGLSSEQARSAPLASTSMTLAGMIKHLAYVEDHWFIHVWLNEDWPDPWAKAPWDDDDDWEWHSAITEPLPDTFALYAAACARSDAAIAQAVADGSLLDQLWAGTERRGAKRSLRWIMLHMIQETARHCGHADLLREAIDGSTGD